MQKDAASNSDRRSLYTKSLIKGSLLELLKTHSFTSISVTMLSETAGIGRNTFYRHYNNTFEALVASIDDALSEIFAVFLYLGIGSEGQLSSLLAPFCEYVLNSDRYRIVFTDSELTSIIIERLIAFNDRQFVTSTALKASCTQQQAEAIVRFQAAGCLDLCNRYAHAGNEEWSSILAVLDAYAARL